MESMVKQTLNFWCRYLLWNASSLFVDEKKKKHILKKKKNKKSIFLFRKILSLSLSLSALGLRLMMVFHIIYKLIFIHLNLKFIYLSRWLIKSNHIIIYEEWEEENNNKNNK